MSENFDLETALADTNEYSSIINGVTEFVKKPNTRLVSSKKSPIGIKYRLENRNERKDVNITYGVVIVNHFVSGKYSKTEYVHYDEGLEVVNSKVNELSKLLQDRNSAFDKMWDKVKSYIKIRKN